MKVLFHKDGLHVDVEVTCDEEEFIENVRLIAKSNVSTLTLCVAAYRFNWLNTIIRPILVNLTIRLNQTHVLLLTDCRLMELQRDPDADLITGTCLVTFYIGGKSISKS